MESRETLRRRLGRLLGSPSTPTREAGKFLAHGGVASRRKAEEIIAKGLVTVGGEVVTDPARDVGAGDDVRVNGKPVAAEAREVWAVNKPAGVVSTAREPGSRPAVVELVDTDGRLYPVGRLDADTTGLLLLTNDGELANRLTHPRYEVPKTYRVRLGKPIADRDLERLRTRRRARGRADGPDRGAPPRRARSRDRPARRPQPPGAADGRSGRQPGGGVAAGRVRTTGAWAACKGRGAAAFG